MFGFVPMNSCKDDEAQKNQVPPVIWYKGYETIASKTGNGDSLLIIKIGYKDENGDIGLLPDDTLPPFNEGIYRYNLLIDLFDADNGGEDTIKYPGTPFNQVFHQRIPDLRPTGRNKYIEGDISVNFDASSLTMYPSKLKVYLQMIDRHQNLSDKLDGGFIYLSH